MKSLKSIVSVGIISSLLLTACIGGEEQVEKKEGVARKPEIKKEVTVFDLSSDSYEISINKTGTTKSDVISNLTAESSGKIKSIKAKVGQSVKKGDSLIEIGNSLATDQAQLDLESSQIAANLQKSNNQATEALTNSSLQAAEIAADISHNNYLNAVNSRDLSYKTYSNNLLDAEIALNSAKESYYTAEENYEIAEESLEDLEDQLEELEDTPGTDDAQNQLKSAISSAEIQLNNLELNLETSENAYIQASQNISKIKLNNKSTLDSLNLAVANAKNQYDNALNAINSAKIQGDIQKIAAKSQQLQADTKLKSAEINNAYLTLKSPITGIITEIQVEETDQVNPGQVLISIQNPKNNLAKTSLTPEEAVLVGKSKNVRIVSSYGESKGKIKTFSPIADSKTKKIDIEVQIQDNEIPSEEFVEIIFELDTEDQLFVPLNSVNQVDGDYLVQVVDSDNRVELVDIEIGEIVGDFIEVNKGLTGKEKIIEAGTNFLSEGEKVKIAKS